jgi:hypothetical protein
MSQRKTGVFSLGGRLTKSVATSAFALSAITGGIALTSGEALATGCSFGISTTNAPCVTGTDYETNPVPTDKLFNIVQIPGTQPGGGGDVEFKWVDVNGNTTWDTPADVMVDEWHVDVDYNPDLQTNQSVFEYIVSIKPGSPNQWFGDATLGSIIGPGTGAVTKDIYTVVNGAQGALIGSITNQGTFTFTPNTYTELYIVDTATPGTSTIDSYQNVYRQTPGPLPILGAGAAFGFSRKLRSRIKGVHAA